MRAGLNAGWIVLAWSFAAMGCGGSGVPASPREYPPKDLVYPTNPAVYIKGSRIVPNTPTVGGGTPAEYAIDPAALPPGLAFDPATGTISGTPTADATATDYTVRA